jgi:hypothetical protein
MNVGIMMHCRSIIGVLLKEAYRGSHELEVSFTYGKPALFQRGSSASKLFLSPSRAPVVYRVQGSVSVLGLFERQTGDVAAKVAADRAAHLGHLCFCLRGSPSLSHS